MWTRARMEFPTMQSVCRLRTVPGKNKRHMKEVAGLVSGVESGVSKNDWAQSTTIGIGGLCANTHSRRP